jgi:hypothetical protein
MKPASTAVRAGSGAHGTTRAPLWSPFRDRYRNPAQARQGAHRDRGEAEWEKVRAGLVNYIGPSRSSTRSCTSVTLSAEPGQSPHCTATERLVRWLGVRYSVVARTAIVGVCGLLGGLVAPESAPVAGAVIAMSTWAVFFATRLLRGCHTWALAVDVLVVSTLCLTQS